MTVTSLVTIPVGHDALERFERAHPEFYRTIGDVAGRCATSHRRIARAGEVVEIEEFPSMREFDEFQREASVAIEKYERLLGVTISTVT